MKEFIIKTIIITFCIAILLSYCIPKYHFFEKDKRCNLITGCSEYFHKDHYGNNTGWRE